MTSRNLHDEDLRLRCPRCGKRFKTREGVRGHVHATLHGEWITDFSMPEDAPVDTHRMAETGTGSVRSMGSAVAESEAPYRANPLNTNTGD